MPFFCGVDGCRAGWFGVALCGPRSWEAELFPTLGELWSRWRRASLILIDMPIGLPGGKGGRRCDSLARAILGKGSRGGPSASSVFPVPCRDAVCASSPAAALAAQRRLTGKGLSRQSLGITAKIRELDRFLRGIGGARGLVRESHPEVCFRAMKGRGLRHRKKTFAGREERIRLLRHFIAEPGKILRESLDRYPRRDCAADDIIDALALAASALQSRRAGLVALAGIPVRDELGLPMEIVFPRGARDGGQP